MISMEQITGEIAALEEEKPTHTTMQKLAALYTVRDHMVIEPIKTVPEVVPEYQTEDEFMRKLSGMRLANALPVLEELMQAVRVVNPRLYDSAVRKLSEM